MDPFEQKRYVVEELKRKLGSPLRTGVGQFESILDTIGLGGALHRDLASVLRIAKSLRNAVAHRGGKVDARVLADLPDLRLEAGQPIQISTMQMNSVISAMYLYAEVIHERRRLAGGLPPRQSELPWVLVPLSELLTPFR